MKTFFLLAHIGAGFLALAIGLVPMFSKKGSRLHVNAGLVYYWCMMIVAISAVILVAISPVTVQRIFLAGIAVLSFYLCFSGRRSLKIRDEGSVQWYDRACAGLQLATGLAMIAFGGWKLYQLTQGSQFGIFSILFVVFGVLCVRNARYDLRKFNQPAAARYGKKEWFFMHIQRMGGSYIATFTAFCVVNVGNILPNAPALVGIATWVLPGIIGGAIIGRTVRFYLAR
jgi:uncharacterized membrane protein